MTFPQNRFTHAATVEPYEGRVGSGAESWGSPLTKVGFLDDEQTFVLSETGEQIVSQSLWYTYLADVDDYPLKSKVTYNGTTSLVLRVRRRDSGSFRGPDHLEVALS